MSLREFLLEEYKGVTSKDMGAMGEHSHPYEVDNFGNGETSPDNTKHVHKINEFSVQPGGADGHGHMIKNPMQEAVDDGELRKSLQVMHTVATQIEDAITGIRNLRKVLKAHRGKELKSLETDLKNSLKSANGLVTQLEKDFS